VHRLFKLYNYTDRKLAKIARDRFTITSTSWDGQYIRFEIAIIGIDGTYDVTEHHAVFKDFEPYYALRAALVKTDRHRQAMRMKNDAAREKVDMYINFLPSL
jgi:hypothetical protein